MRRRSKRPLLPPVAREGQRLVRDPCLRPLHGGDATPDKMLHFLEGPHLDLARALVRGAEFLGQVFKRNRHVALASLNSSSSSSSGR
jgi:hypothetical protein